MNDAETFPILPFPNQKSWENWLEEHHAGIKGVWLKIAKKETGIPTVTYNEALESALCYGWIDGQKKTFDGQFFLQKFTPRRPKSTWSKINCEKVQGLIDAGRMRPAGLIQVEQAKADGRWSAAYESQSRITIPEDFQIALDQHPSAKEFFSTLNSANRYAFLYRLQTIKRPETRAARLEKFIEMLEKHEKFHP